MGATDVVTALLVLTMLVLGMVVGFSAVRTNLIQEFGDVAQALDAIDQSYSYTVNGVTSQFTDTPTYGPQVAGQPPAGLNVTVAPVAGEE